MGRITDRNVFADISGKFPLFLWKQTYRGQKDNSFSDSTHQILFVLKPGFVVDLLLRLVRFGIGVFLPERHFGSEAVSCGLLVLLWSYFGTAIDAPHRSC